MGEHLKPHAGVYLIAMFRKAFQECCRLNPKGYVIAFMALLTWYKCCHAGEVKHDEYNFNTYLQCLETQKHQQKILNTSFRSLDVTQCLSNAASNTWLLLLIKHAVTTPDPVVIPLQVLVVQRRALLEKQSAMTQATTQVRA